MRRLILLVVALTCALVARAAQPPAPLVQDTTPISLFNGRDYTGLHVFVENAATDPTTVLKIEDGMLRCLGVGRGYVRTLSSYADFGCASNGAGRRARATAASC